MQHTLMELERTPGSRAASSHDTGTGNRALSRLRPLRLYLYIFRGVLLLVLTGTIFENGVTIIRQNAKALGFFALNFDVPLPFLLIGLWSIVVLFLALFSISTLVQIYRVVRPRLRRPERVRRAA